jgi:hypothetical protein
MGNGQEMSQLDLQRSFLDMVEEYLAVRGQPNDEDTFLPQEWNHALDTIAIDSLGLVKRADWPQRYDTILQFALRHQHDAKKRPLLRKIIKDGNIVGEEPDWGNPVIQALDLKFDQILNYRQGQAKPAEGMAHRIRALHFGDWMPADPASEAHYRYEAPQTTRARMRGRAVVALAQLGDTYPNASVGWKSFTSDKIHGDIYRYEDPREAHNDYIDRELDRLMEMAT